MKNGRQGVLPLRVRTWGGARMGAGRKPSKRPKVPHRARPVHTASHPVHVTLRVCRDLPNLRTKSRMGWIRQALKAGAERAGFRLVQYSVMRNHLHLIVEASDAGCLSRGVTGLQVRIARRLNRVLERRGRFFDGRYHARALKTPREVRHGLAYVLLNARRHAAERGRGFAAEWIDPCSSGLGFNGWKHRDAADGGLCRTPRTWLLRVGWRRHRLLRLDEVPGGRGGTLETTRPR